MTSGLDFKVLPEDVTAAAANCQSTASELQAQLASLRSYVVSLEGQWVGNASMTFNALMADYDRYSAMLHQALTDIGRGLTGNAVQYTDAETSNVSGLTQVHGQLPTGAGFN